MQALRGWGGVFHRERKKRGGDERLSSLVAIVTETDGPSQRASSLLLTPCSRIGESGLFHHPCICMSDLKELREMIK